MKNSIDKNNRTFKNVFSNTPVSQLQNSKFPLGEDFYSIHTDEIEVKKDELLQIKDLYI